MELKKLAKNSDGNMESTFVITPEQMTVLLWYAVNDLVGRGMATVADISEEEFEKFKKEVEEKFKRDYLASLDTDDLPKA